jgi:hypothetical protein
MPIRLRQAEYKGRRDSLLYRLTLQTVIDIRKEHETDRPGLIKPYKFANLGAYIAVNSTCAVLSVARRQMSKKKQREGKKRKQQHAHNIIKTIAKS